MRNSTYVTHTKSVDTIWVQGDATLDPVITNTGVFVNPHLDMPRLG